MRRSVLALLLLLTAIVVFGSNRFVDGSLPIFRDNLVMPSSPMEPVYYWANEVTEIYTSSCSLVYTTVCVTNSAGHSVRELSLENFTFIENGDTVNPHYIIMLNDCPTESTFVDIVMFLDLSGSMGSIIGALRTHITTFIHALPDEMSFRIAFWTFNGCREEGFGRTAGRRDRYIVDFSDPDCTYDSLASGIWASTADDAQCLFNAGYDYFFSLPMADRGSGDEDQYGMLAEACTVMVFRPEARRIFILFTDERPIYNEEECPPSWGPGVGPDSELYDFIDFMRSHNIEVYPVTPHDGEMDYVRGVESPERAYYTGYYELADSTGGHWFWIHSPDYGAMVDSIAASMVIPEPCCYSFVHKTTASCDSIVLLQIDSHRDIWYGGVITNYNGFCGPQFDLFMPAFSGGITTCEYQEFAFMLNNPYFGLIDAETAHFVVNGASYNADDAELDVTTMSVAFRPSTPYEHADTVIFYIDSVRNTEGCVGFSPVCTFFVDLVPPECFDYYPAEGETLFTMTDSASVRLTDDFSGVNFDAISADNITIHIEGEPVPFGGIEITEDRISIADIELSREGEGTICINDIADTPDYDYCPPNVSSCCWSFSIILSPQAFWLPDTFTKPCDTILIPLFIDEVGIIPIESAEFTLSFDPAVCRPIGIVTDGSLTEGWRINSLSSDSTAGTLDANISGSAIASGEDGIFLFVKTVTNCEAWGGDYCPLRIGTMFLNDGSPRATTEDGYMLVGWRWTEWIAVLELLNEINPDSGLKLAIGGDRHSTDLYDPESDLIILPHIPGFVRAHLAMDDPDYPWITELRRDMQDLEPPNRWKVITFDEPNGTMRWRPHRFPQGKFYLNDMIDMKRDSVVSFGLNDTLIIDWVTPPLALETTCFKAGWNLVSLPVTPPRYTARVVMDFSPVGTFRFNPEISSYSEAIDLDRGKGYWVFASSDTCIKFGGVVLESFNTQLRRGWNMIGATSDTIDISAICTAPEGSILAGSIFRYDVLTGNYLAAEQLIPGEGYWVMALSDALLSVPSGGMYCKAVSPQMQIADMGVVSIGDDKLYYGLSPDASEGINRYDRPLPPPRPDGDYAQNAVLLREGFALQTDISSSPTWFLQVHSPTTAGFSRLPEGLRQLLLTDDKGSSFDIFQGQSIRLSEGIYALKATTQRIESLHLIGAYPNPFNSKVDISFYSNDGRKITVKIYDNLGHLVEEVFRGETSAGINTVSWQSEGPSGNYIYRISDGVETVSGKVLLVR